MAAITPIQGGGSGSGTGLTAGSAAVIANFSQYDSKATRVVVRATGDQTFRLNVMATPDSGTSKAVVKSVASAVVNVDGGTTGYVNAAELDIVPHAEMSIEIWAVGGTLAYYVSKRVEHP
jgi:hypothetical protein